MRILMLGATGLTGRALAEKIAGDERVTELICFVRRKPFEPAPGSRWRFVAGDLQEIVESVELPAADVLVNCLGTTIKAAGSQQEFRRIDLEIPLKFAENAASSGLSAVVNLSSVGADAASKNFYLRTKGELEQALNSLGLKTVHHFRPSLLLGDRQEKRPGEAFARIIGGPLAPLFPALYRPILTDRLSDIMLQYILNGEKGTRIIQGKDLFI